MTVLADIRDLEAGAAYPGQLLEGCKTALVLFAAGFLGKQDAYWIAEAGLRALCVDSDGHKLEDMREMYPGDWAFDRGDVFDIARDAKKVGFQFDVVSLDPWTHDFQRCADSLDLWCSLARRAVILGTGHSTVVTVPEGWRITEVRKRSDYDGGVYWTCLEPA